MEVLFLIVGFISLVLLLFTNRFLVFGFLSIASFLSYFMIVGSGTWLSFFLFLFGILLIILELFIPNFGLIGIIGGLSLGFGYFTSQVDVWGSVLDLALAFILATVTAFILLKKGYSFLPAKTLVLGTSMQKEQGYSAGKDYSAYLRRRGVAVTTLRPSGKVEIDGNVLDVVSNGPIIREGSEVEVIHVEGTKIIVREL
ncbi:hypothetical protein BW727_100579 [Jeotgalibaca dankookensis]|uniref:Uncharacterized protein n=1 Tax=Jeotgalibaca dankookensis TaxID=708126 RepID=A0A1S6IN48_9LACT|nr:NfeD family protein [Jeotgalibaca dankookensis]AQS52972.1 hypothetical protein BW727_100579 [Jeotgalibaca dankookensis]